MMWSIIVTTSLILGAVRGINWTDPVTTPKGQIRGIHAEDGDYSMYLGIPFAKVDAKNPFGISTPHPNFESLFDAIDDSALCPQLGFGETTLDCLHLNIHVPNKIQIKLPVLVWIYGGGFTSGSAGRLFYGSKFLVRHDIIFVSLNYRIGPYGFMCLDTEEVPGNQGLKDQYLALKWIHENIASFGGDVDKITVMGESAGAMSLDLHLMSDLPKFYNQAILQSGVGLIPMVVIPSDKTVPVRIAKHLGYTTEDVKEALSFLANASTDSVIASSSTLNIPLTLCVEKEFPNVERFISVHPEHNNISHVRNMSIMAGFSSYEQLGLFIKMPIEFIKQSFFRDYLAQQYDTDYMDSMIDKVKRFYIGDEKISDSVGSELIDFSSDFVFNFPIQRSVVKYLESGARVYQYMFSYDGDRNFYKIIINIKREGAAHADELGYLFDMAFLQQAPTVEDQLMIDRMTTMWTNFVKYGNPTPATSAVIPVIWSPASKDTITYLDINSNLTVSTRPYNNRMTFWDLFLTVNEDKLLANQPSSSTRLSISLGFFFVIALTYLLIV